MPIKLQGTNSAAAPGLTNDGGDGVVVGTDSVDISTGGTSRLKVDSSGRLLLGTTTEGHANADDFTIEGAAATGITIRSGTSDPGAIYFSDGTSGGAEYQGYVQYDHSLNALQLGTSTWERIRVDTDGHVNIGCNTSANPLTYLRFGATQYGAADIRPTDEGSHKVGLAFYTDGTADSTINPVEVLKISSAGYVTTPKQPVCVRSNSTAKSGSDIEWKYGVIDQGSNWDSTNNRFTAPVAGMYFVSMYGMSNTSQATMDVQVCKNGTQQNYIVPYSGGGGAYNHFAGMGIVSLAANDYVHVTQSSGDMYYAANGRHTGLSIFLIG